MKIILPILIMLSVLAITACMPPPTEGGEQPSMFTTFLPFLLMFVVMYIFFILPKQKENKKIEQMRSSLKKGDKVLTMAGIIGVISHIDDRFVCVKTGDTKIDFEKTAIIKLMEADSEKREAQK
ncbi:MAG: preprotein translocase subunit YajC [Fibromonadales bacterium]|nr:preprotein translocase subunit YajC [Fibromonadales bacterium]